MSREKRIERAQMKVLFAVPFFAPAVAKLPVRFEKGVGTAATDGKGIVWDPDWFDKLPDAVLPTVLCHESAHCLLGHLWRAPAGVDWELWNKAADHAVNLMLKEWSALVMSKRLADPFPFPDPPEAYLANPAFSGMSEEKIYACLRDQSQQGGKPGNGPQGSGQGGKGNPKGQGQGQPRQGKGKPQGQPGQGQPGQHSMPAFGQMQQPKAADTTQKKLHNNWNQTIGQCVQMAKGRGDIPGSLTQYVGELFSPKTAWYEIVRSWLRENASDDWNWLRPNPLFDGNSGGLVVPSLDNESIGAIVFGKDTSGSVCCYPEICSYFVGEQQNCLDEMRPKRLIDICCDTAIHSCREYVPGDTIDKEFPGGGGTSFVPVFEHCDTLPMLPKCLVYLTDLDGTFPDKEPPYPVLWVVYGGSKEKPPFGEVVYAD
ncbi:MAG TPA: VWA-like domain-containing protein [Candidatus Paceibacterota bacterium]